MKNTKHGLKPRIRQETASDHVDVYNLIKEAFSNVEYADGDEQDLVVKLRNSDEFIPELSMVAEVYGQIIGHILLTKTTIGEGYNSLKSLVLAPVSVLPEFQNLGIGSMLINEAHKLATLMGYGSVVLIGHAEYYPRFGYEKASKYGIKFRFDVPDEAAMVIELWQGALEGVNGYVKLPEAFGPQYT